ncbi:hypothetical protein WJX73_001032 [Symbiochloris irregularis]|uniref:Bromo domain-containing protein n=1 Tax=Symbiochloris irregularis TaxID=706552 RepID=A0AAW1Q285_9CHLO
MASGTLQAGVRKALLQVLHHAMKDDSAVAFFNEPVDAEGLGFAQDYFSVVKVPMDLGTVLQKLESGQYAEPIALLRDVGLIWRNCRAFNMPGSDVSNACDHLEGVFDKLWRKNKLDKLTGGLVSQSCAQEGQGPSAAAGVSQPAGGAHGGKTPAAADGRSLPLTTAKQSGRKNVQIPKGAGPGEFNSLRNGHPLQRCLNVVSYLLSHPNAEPFSVPVDVREFTDYSNYVRQPMDLGTIRDRLAPGASQGWGTITYKSIGEVLADVRLVWRNCRAYNGPNQPITDAARELETIFERAWTTAGLTLDGPTPSQADSMGASLGSAHSPRPLQSSGPASPSLLNRRSSAEGIARQNMLGSQLAGRNSLGHHADPSGQSLYLSASRLMNQQYQNHHQQQQQQQQPQVKAPAGSGSEDTAAADLDGNGRRSRSNRGARRRRDSGSDSDSQHSLSGGSDSAGSWQPRRKSGGKRRRASGATSNGSGGGRTRCVACIKAKRGRCGTIHAGSDCLRRKQAEQAVQQAHGQAMYAGAHAHGQAGMHLPGMMGEAFARGANPNGMQPGGLTAQQQAYALAKQRADAADMAKTPTDAENAVLVNHSHLIRARERAQQAQRAAEAALHELAAARHVLRQVEAAEAARQQQARRKAPEPGVQAPNGWVPQHSHPQQQQQQQQQSSVDSVTTHQRANHLPPV